jgi:hypothetical protein
MSTHEKGAVTRKIALGLIVLAVLGTEISYHLTLETRFNAIEEKLQTLSGLNKQLTTLQSSFEPLGKSSKDQSDALTALRAQIAALQQAQSGQQDAQRKLSDYISQLEANVKKARAEAAAAAAAKPTPAPASPIPATLPASAAVPVAPASSPQAAPSVSASDLLSSPGAVAHSMQTPSESSPRAAPKPGAGMALRPAETTSATDETHSRRALPVGASFSKQP